MKSFVLTGAVALMGMTAIPAQADMALTGDDVVMVLAQADDSNSDDITDLTGQRFYSQDRSTYVVLDPATSAWMVYDANTDGMLRTMARAEFDPFANGYLMATAEPMPVARATTLTVVDGDRADITDLTGQRFWTEDRASYVVLDPATSAWVVYDAESGAVVRTMAQAEFDPFANGYLMATAEPLPLPVTRTTTLTVDDSDRADITDLTGQRFWSEDRATYVVLDPASSAWVVYDAETDAIVRTMAQAEFDPFANGYIAAAAEPVVISRGEPTAMPNDMDDGDNADITDLTAGMAQERWYDRDRTVYGVFDPDTRSYAVYEADTDRLVRTVPEAEFTRYDAGYTVFIPGSIQTGMSSEAESTLQNLSDGDRDDATDLTQ